MFHYRRLCSNLVKQASNKYFNRSLSITNQLRCESNDRDNDNKADKFFNKNSRFVKFEDKDANIIFDDLDSLLNQKQPRNQSKFKTSKMQTLTRGKSGVFDVDEMVELLREENFKDIAVIEVPKSLKYCDYMIICTANSNRHLKSFIGYLNKIYKMKKDSKDPFLDLNDNSNDWRLIDLENLIVHIFMKKTREFYDIETLWAIGEQYDDKIQRPETNIVKDILDRHFKFSEQQSKNIVSSQ